MAPPKGHKNKERNPPKGDQMKDEKEAEIVLIPQEDKMNFQPQVSPESNESESNKQKEHL
jgi:hypothetical protein